MSGHDSFLLFGATGDLSVRYLFPSLVHLLRDRLLPADFQIVAIGRHEYDDAGFRAWLESKLSGEAARNRDALAQLLSPTVSRSVDLSDRQAAASGLSPFAARECVHNLAFPAELIVTTLERRDAAEVFEIFGRDKPRRRCRDWRVEHALDRTCATDLADAGRRVTHPLEELERMAVSAPVIVRGHDHSCRSPPSGPRWHPPP